MLIDTLSRSDNLRFLEGSYTGTPSNVQDLRVALYRSISKVTSQDENSFLQNHNVLTPEDTEDSYIRLTNLQLRSRGYPELDISLDITYIRDYVETTYPGDCDKILPEVTESEEEVISYLRSIQVPLKVPVMRTNYCRYVDKRSLEPIHKDLKIIPPCKHKLVRFLGEETHWMFCALSLWKKVILTHMKRNQIDKVFTIGDTEGVLYNVVNHHLRESIPNLGGAPIWDCQRRALENVECRGIKMK